MVLNEIDNTVEYTVANSAEDGLKALLRSTPANPDYIFLDLNLPLMTGFECLYNLKKNTLLKDIPVVIYSTSSRDIDRQKTKDLGAMHYISKPGSMHELKDLLQRLFK